MKQLSSILVITVALMLSGRTAARAALIFDLGSSWQWLHPQGGAASDPELTDPDFNDPATGGWNSSIANFAANYNGPAFQPAAPAMLGYGNIDLPPGVVTNITDPGNGNRFTAYFRKEFALAAGQYILDQRPDRRRRHHLHRRCGSGAAVDGGSHRGLHGPVYGNRY
jgi:hypothetical protein